MSDRLNIFEVLQKIDEGDKDYLRRLPEHHQKQFVPFVTMQWLNCTDDLGQKVLLNEVVNKRIFKLHKHPELLYQLMVSIGDGRKKFYKWKKPPTKQYKFPKAVKVVKEATGYSTERANDSLKVLSNDVIVGFAMELGYQKDQLKELQKELSKR